MTPDLTTLTVTTRERARLANALVIAASMVEALGDVKAQREILALWERVQPDAPEAGVDKWIA